MERIPVAVTLWQSIGGWIVIVTIFGWFAWYFAPGFLRRSKIRDMKTGRVSKAWWLGRRSRRKPPGPFLKS
jgi:hypothetical protein